MTMFKAMMNDNIESKVDSPMNCLIKSHFTAPVTFLTPISLIRVEDLAVVKFIKLMQAMSRINTAIAEKIYTYSMMPPPFRLYR